jgi:hypothetical protein
MAATKRRFDTYLKQLVVLLARTVSAHDYYRSVSLGVFATYSSQRHERSHETDDGHGGYSDA